MCVSIEREIAPLAGKGKGNEIHNNEKKENRSGKESLTQK